MPQTFIVTILKADRRYSEDAIYDLVEAGIGATEEGELEIYSYRGM